MPPMPLPTAIIDNGSSSTSLSAGYIGFKSNSSAAPRAIPPMETTKFKAPGGTSNGVGISAGSGDGGGGNGDGGIRANGRPTGEVLGTAVEVGGGRIFARAVGAAVGGRMAGEELAVSSSLMLEVFV